MTEGAAEYEIDLLFSKYENKELKKQVECYDKITSLESMEGNTEEMKEGIDKAKRIISSSKSNMYFLVRFVEELKASIRALYGDEDDNS